MQIYANKLFDTLETKIMNDVDNTQFTIKGWKPIVQASTNARILIIGQAPGLETQEKGGVFHDRSGDRLREWLNIDEDTFYNSGLIAVLPMDFYFPGKGKSGDLPPRKEFAEKWHQSYIKAMPNVQLTILIGKYAQDYYLPNSYGKITDNVLNFKQFLPTYFPLVHPSPRNQMWMAKHPEFSNVVLPELKEIVDAIIKS